MRKTVLCVGGGSIGHIAPAVAVAQDLRQMQPDVVLRFVCGPRFEETDYVTKEGFECDVIHAPRLTWSFPWKFLKAVKEARLILNRHKPDVIFSKGGYVSVPMCYAASQKKIPIILHESDAISGRANKLVGRWATKICLGFGDTRDTEGKYVVTGNPVRQKINKGSEEEGRRVTGFADRKPVLLVTGGSQGSVALNEAVIRNADVLLKICNVIHLTGAGKTGLDQKKPGYWSAEFVVDELPHLYAISSLAICRAGFGNIAELAANGIPGILVPLRGVAHDHQLQNAVQAESTGGFTLLDQKRLANDLIPTVSEMLQDPTILQDMRKKSKILYNSHAAGQIAQIILKCLAEEK